MKKVHFIGIAGMGMSSVAGILKDCGYKVSGSDEVFYPPASDYINSLGIEVKSPYSSKNIPADVDMIVIGKSAKLVPEKNEEVKKALGMGVRILSFPEVLRDISKNKEEFVVVGSYGKSTCAALATHILRYGKKDPGYFIGALPYGFEKTGKNTDSNIFVIEGDEYPASNFTTESKFSYFDPEVLLLISGAHDHVNIFKTEKDYLKPYISLVSKMTPETDLIYCIDNPNTSLIVRESRAKKTSYSLNNNDADWYAQNIRIGEISSFELWRKNKIITELSATLLGHHNIQNIVGVCAALLERGLVKSDILYGAISEFKGLKRRLDKINNGTITPVYEGFGSSYDKARAAIKALGEHFPKKNILIVFEPHTFTWRNRDSLHLYDDVFTGVKKVLVYRPPTEHGKVTKNQLKISEIIERISSAGVKTSEITDKNWKKSLSEFPAKNIVILILSSGDMGGLIKAIPTFIDNKFNETI